MDKGSQQADGVRSRFIVGPPGSVLSMCDEKDNGNIHGKVEPRMKPSKAKPFCLFVRSRVVLGRVVSCWVILGCVGLSLCAVDVER